jgi:DNA adenine methylase
MNAPIKYFGGKGGMFNEIIKHFPEPTYKIYVEPFSGTYTVGLHMPYIPEIEVFNDLEKNVYTLYKVIRDDELFEKFKLKVSLTPYSEDMRYEAKEHLKNDDLSDIDRAYYFFILNRFSHNGIGGFSVNLVTRRKMSKSVSDYLSAVDRLEELHQRLQHILVYNRDGLELMVKFSQENCFLYCDPPYVWSTRGATRYIIDNDSEWHKKFVEKCIASNAKILISGYDCDEYKPLEENGFTKISFDVNTIDGTLKPKIKTECLWKNY